MSAANLDNIAGKLDDIFKEQRESYSKFFYQIALFSAGTISLSITFLGFLNNVHANFNQHQLPLVISWVLLIISLIASIFRNYVYNHFGHYQVISKYNEEVYKITKKNEHKNDLDETRKKEKLFEVLWKISEYAALIAFPTGIIFLIYFSGIELL